MKTQLNLAAALLLLSTNVAQLSTASAQGTAFTYQGRLNDGANPAGGSYDLRFAIYDALSVGSQAGSPLTNSATAVSNGLFTVTLDFGNQFPGANRWLEIAVRTNGGGGFTTLTPRQPLTPAPYAITAGNVVSGGLAAGTYGNTVNFSNAANQFAGNGGALSNVNATTLGGVAASNVWQTGGNAGANSNWYLGTADYQPLELRVNKARALRITPTVMGWPNVTAGASNNVIFSDVTAASINGGVNNSIADTCGGAVVGGGRNNRISTNAAGSFIGGGQWNFLGDGSVRSVIGGGYSNQIRGFTGTNAAGIARDITDGTSNTLLIGEQLPGNATVGGGYANTVGTNASAGVIGGGYANSLGNDCVGGVISGGESNRIGDGSVRGFIGGGRFNAIQDGTANTIMAGELNTIQTGSAHSTIGGGRWNTNSGPYAVVPGGARNHAGGAYSFAAGRRGLALHDGSFVWADAQDADFASTAGNQFNVRADGSVRFITSGAGMTLDGQPVLAGSNGGLLTNLNAGMLASGTVPDDRLSANVALRNATNTFTGDQFISGGRLGIGTAAPLAPLHVHAAINVPSSVVLSSGGSWPLALTQTPSSIMVVSNGGAGRIFMSSSGNVGIGNTTPLHRLHVGTYGTLSTINSASQKSVVENTNENARAAYLAVAGPGATASATNRVEVALEADEGQRIGLLGTMSAHPLQVRVDNNTRMLINTNGNVGIGTTTPQQRLDVAGSVRIQVGPTTVLVNSDGSVSITSSTNITFSTTGDISLGGRDVTLNASRNLTVTSGSSATVTTSGTMDFHATGTLDLQGSTINLN